MGQGAWPNKPIRAGRSPPMSFASNCFDSGGSQEDLSEYYIGAGIWARIWPPRAETARKACWSRSFGRKQPSERRTRPCRYGEGLTRYAQSRLQTSNPSLRPWELGAGAMLRGG